MKKLIFAVSLSLALVALAENPLGVSPNYGTVLANDGGSATNQYNSPPYNTFGFGQAGQTTVTVWCDEDSLVGVNRTTCTKSACLPVPLGIPISMPCRATSFLLRDGGGYNGCMVVNAPNVTDGGVVSQCYWSGP